MPFLLDVPLSDGEIVLGEVAGQVDDVAPFGRGKEALGRLLDLSPADWIMRGRSQLRFCRG